MSPYPPLVAWRGVPRVVLQPPHPLPSPFPLFPARPSVRLGSLIAHSCFDWVAAFGLSDTRWERGSDLAWVTEGRYTDRGIHPLHVSTPQSGMCLASRQARRRAKMRNAQCAMCDVHGSVRHSATAVQRQTESPPLPRRQERTGGTGRAGVLCPLPGPSFRKHGVFRPCFLAIRTRTEVFLHHSQRSPSRPSRGFDRLRVLGVLARSWARGVRDTRGPDRAGNVGTHDGFRRYPVSG